MIALRSFTTYKKVNNGNTGYRVIIFVLLALSFVSGNCKESDKKGDANNASEITEDTNNTFITSNIIESSLKNNDSKVFWMNGIQLESAPLIFSFYNENNFKPVWTNGTELTNQSKEIISLLKDSYNYGIDPENFDINELENYSRLLQKEKNLKNSAWLRASFEFQITNSIFSFMLQISKGTDYSIISDVTDSDFPFISQFPDFLTKNLSSTNISAEILRLQPENIEYVTLQKEVELIALNTNPTDHTINVPELNDSLNVTYFLSYFLSREKIENDSLNSNVYALLLEFQENAGIQTSGKLDIPTRQLLNNAIVSRYADLAKSLDQIRKENSIELSTKIGDSNSDRNSN